MHDVGFSACCPALFMLCAGHFWGCSSNLFCRCRVVTKMGVVYLLFLHDVGFSACCPALSMLCAGHVWGFSSGRRSFALAQIVSLALVQAGLHYC